MVPKFLLIGFLGLATLGCGGGSDAKPRDDLSPPPDSKGIGFRDGVILQLRDGDVEAPGDAGVPLDGAVADTRVDKGLPVPDARVDKGPPPPDSTTDLPAARYIERSLTFTGPGGSEWLHLFTRAPGADAVGVQMVRKGEGTLPPYVSISLGSVRGGECQRIDFSGTMLDGVTPFTVWVTYCLNDQRVRASHSSSVDNNAPTPSLSHGEVSMDPHDQTRPYERMLRFVGTGGTEWTHVARRDPGASRVSVETFSYSEDHAPAVHHYQLTALAPGGCQVKALTGTFVANGKAFAVHVRYCRSGDDLNIEHTSTVDGNTSVAQPHGTIAIDP